MKKEKFNFEQVFKVFEENYKLVPLEVFSDNPYEALVATVLSARTNDDTTLKVCQRLFKVAPDVHSLSKISLSTLEGLIYPVGFYKTKAKHLLELSNKLIYEYDSVVPNTRESLMSLPGVGRKTANLVLNRAFGIPAIAVDTHVHKITNILGWVKSKTPEETEKQLTAVLPRSYWPETNKLFVSIGRQFRTKDKLVSFLKSNGLID